MKWMIAAFMVLFFSQPGYAVGIDVNVLQEPVDVVSVEMYKDGGTISFHLKDVRGELIKGCMEGRATKMKGHFYLGAEHPSRKGARLVLKGSEKEKRILFLLSNWLERTSLNQDEDESGNEQDLNEMRWIVSKILERIDLP